MTGLPQKALKAQRKHKEMWLKINLLYGYLQDLQFFLHEQGQAQQSFYLVFFTFQKGNYRQLLTHHSHHYHVPNAENKAPAFSLTRS